MLIAGVIAGWVDDDGALDLENNDVKAVIFGKQGKPSEEAMEAYRNARAMYSLDNDMASNAIPPRLISSGLCVCVRVVVCARYFHASYSAPPEI